MAMLPMRFFLGMSGFLFGGILGMFMIRAHNTDPITSSTATQNAETCGENLEKRTTSFP
jgi:hypothetical protein